MGLAEARIYTSSPVQSAFHYLSGALLSAGFDEAELQRSKRRDEVSLVIWKPTPSGSGNSPAASPKDQMHDLDPEAFYACGIQGSFSRQDKKKKKTFTFSWELRLDYEPPRELGDNTNRLYHVDIQCLLREDKSRRPTENISFHYNNEPHPAKWDVVRNWIRFALDLRALNPPAWAALKSRLDVGEVVFDSINRRNSNWSSPPSSPVKHPVVGGGGKGSGNPTADSHLARRLEIEEQMRPFARHVWAEWALPNISRHYLCDVTRKATASARDKTRGEQGAESSFVGCDGHVDWELAGQRHSSLRASLDGFRSPRMSVDTRSSSSTGTSSETRTLREGDGRYRLGDVNEDLYEDQRVGWD